MIPNTSKIDYSKINHHYKDALNGIDWDIVVIVPCYNRQYFNNVFLQTMLSAINYVSKQKNIHLVLVEFCEYETLLHCPAPKHIVSHITVYKQNNELFNKCLLHNIGALYFNKAKYFLFHDIDVLVPINFFESILLNLKHHNALQTFTKKRLLQLDKETTEHLITTKTITLDRIMKEHVYTENKVGAPGGSILVEKELFFKIGGYDADVFTEYSIEDQMFFDKVKLIGNFGFCDNPAIELVHCWHPPSNGHIVKDAERNFYEYFNTLSADQKKTYIYQKGFEFITQKNKFL